MRTRDYTYFSDVDSTGRFYLTGYESAERSVASTDQCLVDL